MPTPDWQEREKEAFRADCWEIGKWWCEMKWRDYLEREPDMQVEIIFWDLVESVFYLSFVGPFLFFTMPIQIFLYKIDE